METIDRLESFLGKQAELIKKIHPQPEWKAAQMRHRHA